MENSELKFVKNFQKKPLMLLMISGILIIGDEEKVFALKSDFTIGGILKISPLSL